MLDVGGANIPNKTEQLLSSQRIYANYFLLVFDNEGRAREVIEELLRAKVIEGASDEYKAKAIKKAVEKVRATEFESKTAQQDALRQAASQASQQDPPPGEAPEFLLWRENLEADNFDVDEIRQVLEAHARTTEPRNFELPLAEIEKEVAREGKRPVRVRRGVASIVVDMASTRGFEIGKPELARLLARYAWEHQERNGARRPLIDLAEHLWRLTHADRRLAGQLRW